MDVKLIFDGKVTLEDLVQLNEMKGYEFVIEAGVITHVIHE